MTQEIFMIEKLHNSVLAEYQQVDLDNNDLMDDLWAVTDGEGYDKRDAQSRITSTRDGAALIRAQLAIHFG